MPPITTRPASPRLSTKIFWRAPIANWAPDFDLDAFAHYAPYNARAQRIEMYLVSLKRQSVRLAAGMVDFAAGEAVHTEDSHKYTIESFREIAARAGFMPRAVWCDARPACSASIGWKAVTGRHQSAPDIRRLQHGGGGIAEEQFLRRGGR